MSHCTSRWAEGDEDEGLPLCRPELSLKSVTPEIRGWDIRRMGVVDAPIGCHRVIRRPDDGRVVELDGGGMRAELKRSNECELDEDSKVGQHPDGAG